MARFKLEGKTALVTGGQRGIGFETAKALHARGANVTITDISAEGVKAAVAAFDDGGPARGRVLGLVSDVRDEAAVRAAVDATVERFGGLDVAIANAGITAPTRPVSTLSAETFDNVLAVNLHGVVHTVRASLPQIVSRGGHLVLISSIYAFTNGALQAPYATAKAGVEALGRALQVELQPHGATVTVAYFGFIDTRMVSDVYEDPVTQKLDRAIPAPLRKKLPPSEAASGIVEAVEKRAPHVLLPRRWELLRWGRGVIGPSSDLIARHYPTLQRVLPEAEAAD